MRNCPIRGVLADEKITDFQKKNCSSQTNPGLSENYYHEQ